MLSAAVPVTNGISLAIGGVGGVYLLAEPGELVIEVEKRDKNEQDKPTNLKAILLGPDRKKLDAAIIPDDGLEKGAGLGEPRRVRLSAKVERKGVHVLNVTVTHDRYGEEILWGFTANCSKVLIETSRGHKDTSHREPLVLGRPGQAGNICFLPQPDPITIEVSGQPDKDSTLTLYDPAGAVIDRASVSAAGKAVFQIPGDERRAVRSDPFRLHLPDFVGTVKIDGVTRWHRRSRVKDLCLWSPTVSSFFPLHDHRWILTPYRRVVYGLAGTRQEIRFRVHNNAAVADTIRLSTDGKSLPVLLPQASIPLAPNEARFIDVIVTIPESVSAGATLTAPIIATSSIHPDYSTWSTVEVRIGASAPLTLDGPLVYRPYEHEHEQFGYTPDYPNDNQIYFSPSNTPFIRTEDGVHRAEKGRWKSVDAIAEESYRPVGSKIAFGRAGEVCLLDLTRRGVAYLVSFDGGDSFTACPIPRKRGRRKQWDIEQFAGHNVPHGLAPFVRATRTDTPDPKHRWRRVNDLELFIPQVQEGEIVVGDPILLTTQSIGISAHSGIPSTIASHGDRIHVVWGEATDPDGGEPGVPMYAVTIDRTERRALGEPAFVGFGRPSNDVHNTPSIAIDSDGYLHTLAGTHGKPFVYAKSLKPDTAHAGFTEPEEIEKDLRSTYIGLVCDPDDTLHLVFRAWKEDGKYHPVGHCSNLAYKRKRKGEPWEDTRYLAVAPFTEYGVWYHRLTIDCKGRLFLSYNYWSTYWFYRTDHVGARRKTMMSADGGETWKLLETADLSTRE